MQCRLNEQKLRETWSLTHLVQGLVVWLEQTSFAMGSVIVAAAHVVAFPKHVI